MLRTFIQFTALIFTLESAIFLVWGNLQLSPRVIAQLAATKLDYNPDVIKNLSKQYADTWIGVFLLLAAFAFQMWNVLWPMSMGGFMVNLWGVIIAILIGLVVFRLCFLESKKIAARNQKMAIEILEKMLLEQRR